jgi:hypothetical protein
MDVTTLDAVAAEDAAADDLVLVLVLTSPRISPVSPVCCQRGGVVTQHAEQRERAGRGDLGLVGLRPRGPIPGEKR